MKIKSFRGLAALIAICILSVLALTQHAFAANDGLIGANIQDGQLLGYYGPGGDIEIPDTVTMIAPEAFKGNDNVTSVTIPGSVSIIGYSAFEGCTELERIVFSDPVDGADIIIRVNAFIDCPKLTECEIPACAKYVTANVFKGCYSMDKIQVHPENPYYCTDDDGILFGPNVIEGSPDYDDPNLTLIGYPNGRAGGYIVPEKVNGRTVDRIWASAFRKAAYLTDIEISSTIKDIRGDAFEETGLKSIVIPDTVEEIGSNLFENSKDLEEVTLPEGMTSIPYGFFMGCESLTRVNFPSTITSLEMYSFANCTSLTSLVMPRGLASITLAAFEGCTNIQRVVVPASVINFPSDSDLGAYDPFEDAPNTLVVYVEKGSTGEKWAINNVEDWGYSYEVLDDVSDTDAIDAGSYYLINTVKKVRADGEFPIGASLNIENVTSGAEYTAFKAQAPEGSVKAYNISLLPSSITAPEEIGLKIGLPSSFTNKAKLYKYTDGEAVDLNAPIISKTFSTTASELGYFGIADNTVAETETDEVISVRLNKTSAELEIGKKVQLSATVLPSNASDKSITWSSSDKNVATVTNGGAVTAVSAGTAVITAAASNGVKAECTITVKKGASEGDKIQANASIRSDLTSKEEGKSSFNLSLSKASRIASVQVTFTTPSSDATVTAKNGFTLIGTNKNALSGGQYEITAVLSYLNESKELFFCTDETDIAEISVNASSASVKITELKITGWDDEETVSYGTVGSISPDEAIYTVPSKYDVNTDGEVDILDLTYAQLYYRAIPTDSYWSKASACDVNGDGVVDIEDYLEIWANFS